MVAQPIKRLTHEQRRERRRQIAESIRNGLSVGEVAQQFEVGAGTVSQAAEEFGVGINQLKAAARKRIANEFDPTRPASHNAAILGIPAHVAYRAYQEAGIKLKIARPDPDALIKRSQEARQRWANIRRRVSPSPLLTRDEVRRGEQRMVGR